MSITIPFSPELAIIWKLVIVFMLVISVAPGISAEETMKIALPLQIDTHFSPNLWENAGKDSTVLPAPVTIELTGDYDPVAGMVNLRAAICAYTTLPDSCRISVIVVEERHSVSRYPAGDTPEGDFIVCNTVTGPYGEPLHEGTLVENTCIMKRYAVQLDRTWDTNRSTVVVFIHTGATGAAHVLQAALIDIADM